MAGLIYLILFPNPAKDRINIQFGGDINTLQFGILVDLNGKVIARFSAEELQSGSLDISEIQGGHYILKVASHSARYTQPILVID